ncbi:MAG: glutathione S-transferase family protein [Robiginitomaculum sp.]|nr:glutathione S-transferase family protein [Robiginitomaculum sp.]
MLKIYGHFMSMPTNKVRLCVSYLGLPHEYIHVDLQGGEQLKPEYLEVNPAGRVPAIDDSGFKLSQSDAINKYLCALSGPSAFYPQEPQEQAIINQWADMGSHHVLPAMARIFFNKIIAKLLGQEPDEASIKTGESMLERDLPFIDAQLQDNEYLAGDKITLADINLLAALEPADMCGVDLAKYTAIAKWREGLMKQEFYQSVHAHFAAEMAGD